MKKTDIKEIIKTYILFTLVILPTFIFSQTTITPNTSATTLAQTIVGPGVTITSAHFNKCGGVPTGSVVSAGTFTNVSGDLGSGMANGVILTTGNVADANNMQSYLASTQLGYTYNDPNLQTINTNAIYDVCSLSFTFTPVCSELSITFVFGSEELPKYVCGTYNDAFGIFLNGPNPGGGNYVAKNIAVLSNPQHTPVEIDSINNNYMNNCFPAPNPGPNVSYYVNNSGTHHYSDVVYDGFTIPVTSVTSVMPCSTYVMEIAIGESGNGKYDSGVFIKGNSVSCTATPSITASTTPNNCNTNNGTATIHIANYSGTPSYSWTPGGQTTNSISGLSSGTYSCLVSLPGCSSTYTQVVAATISSGTVVSTSNVTITSNPSTFCVGLPVTLTASGASNYTWSTGATTPAITVSVSGTYSVVGITCGNTNASQTITFIPNPTVQISPISAICPGDSLKLTASGATSFHWSTGSNSNSIYVHTAGSYSVTGTNNGCINTTTATVSTISLTASFSVSPNNGSPTLNVIITNNSIGATSYSWNLGNGGTSILQNPNTSYQNPGTYTITLTATQGSCNEIYSQTVTVNEQVSSVLIPNIFTPNGDGINDVFTITGISISDFNCVIYDRWGLDMFESNQITNSWDGKNKNGNEVPTGIYYYIINAKGLDLKSYTYKGFVTLIR